MVQTIELHLQSEIKREKMSNQASFQTASKKFKGDSRYTGSDNEDDDLTMNKGFIQYSMVDDSNEM